MYNRNYDPAIIALRREQNAAIKAKQGSVGVLPYADMRGIVSAITDSRNTDRCFDPYDGGGDDYYSYKW